MPSFDSIVVVEDWISEHYFTTDSTKESFQSEVLRLRKQWDEQVKDGNESVLKRFLGERGTFQVDLAELLEEPGKASAVYHKVREALGYKGTTTDYAAERAGTTLQVPNVWKSHNGDVLFLESCPVESIEDLLDSAKAKMMAAASIDDKEEELSTPKLVSELYRSDDPPQFIVVFAGRWLLLTERERWAEGRYLAADLLLACERNDTKRGGEIDRVLAIFGWESLLPDANESIWWNQILENSVKHTIGVSKDLREGIRLSIEIIANDVLRRRGARDLPLDGVDGQNLARQSLRYLYRLLFLLYAEASPEMGVLPVGVGEYDKGYGLDRLRELALNVPQSERARSGTHIYQSLGALFRLVDQGHEPAPGPATELNRLDEASAPAEGDQGLQFGSLKADLFDPQATADIDLVGLSNAALQKVLEHLLLSKEIKGKDRGFISYAELGVNQLGAVYEGLMSYTGFIAETDLYEVAQDGDSSKGSWVVPIEDSESIERRHFVMASNELTGEPEPVLHEKGTFVFRLAGRERQQSASYYTPEVLTRFVVSQALEELLGKKLEKTTADDILKLTVCEPALGSGAFAIEAVRQLAEAYLKLKQVELGKGIPAENYALELQKVKAHIALHQVYGVDLNATAVELAEVSLWLDTMVAGLQAPWFGLHLRRGNSLIGARRATYSRASVNDKSWLTTAPLDARLSGLSAGMADGTDDPNVVGRIHHFLLPAAGWGAAADASEVKDLAAASQTELREWRGKIRAMPTKKQVDRLVNLGRRVETLWQFALRRIEVAEKEARRSIEYFGRLPEERHAHAPVTRSEIEEKLRDPDGAYQRLRRVMDAWCAFWFWPLGSHCHQKIRLPSMDEWIQGLEALLGNQAKDSKMAGQYTLVAGATWNELNEVEELELGFAGVAKVSDALRDHPWLNICEDVSSGRGFFHWELEYAPVFARGGFDLQVGNPPWVRPEWDEPVLLAEFDVWWALESNALESAKVQRRTNVLKSSRAVEFLVGERSYLAGTAAFLSSIVNFPKLNKLQIDLYRCFIERTWRSQSSSGHIGLVHPESHFSEPKAGNFREEAYLRLRRHFQFRNELKLFEIGNTRTYGVHVYGHKLESVNFVQIGCLYHPDTASRSILHDGSGPLPGVKDDKGDWDLRPHRSRLVAVNDGVLESWQGLFGSEADRPRTARILYPLNESVAHILQKVTALKRMADFKISWTRGWEEDKDRKNGVFVRRIDRPKHTADVILQGPHIAPLLPYAQEPKTEFRTFKDYRSTDLDSAAGNFIPRTIYQRAVSTEVFAASYPKWDGAPASDYFRLGWRRMVDSSTVRTLQAALLAPGMTAVGTVLQLKLPTNRQLVVAAGVWSSLCADFLIKVSGATELKIGTIQNIPLVMNHQLEEHLILRVLRLNAVTEPFAALWGELYSDKWSNLGLIQGSSSAIAGDANWSPKVFIRRDLHRKQAEAEIDAIVAIMWSVNAEELIAIYRTQFPVLRAYENTELYDSSGRKVPVEVRRLYNSVGDNLTAEERTATNAAGNVYTYELPFVCFDREADMREAHARFTKVMEGTN